MSLTTVVKSRPFVTARLVSALACIIAVILESTIYEEEAKILVIPLIVIALVLNHIDWILDWKESKYTYR